MTSSSRTKAAEDDTPNWEEKEKKNENKRLSQLEQPWTAAVAGGDHLQPALLLRKGQVALEAPSCGHRDNVNVAQYFF